MRALTIGLLVGATFLTGCTHIYQPTEYPLRPGLIAPMDITGSTTVSNDQPSTDSLVVHSYSGIEFTSNLNAITDLMVKQTTEELGKNGHEKPGQNKKTIALKVQSLKSSYIAFYWKSEIDFEATLGNGQTIPFAVHHSTGANALQDLNGCIAEGVMNLLRDDRVRTYLSS